MDSTIKEIITNLGGTPQKIKRGTIVCAPNDKKKQMFFIITGAIRVYLIDENEEHTIRFGYKDSITGPLDTFLSGEPTKYYVEAIKETQLVSFTREEIEKVMHEKVNYQLYWAQLLENLILQQMEREIDLLISSPKERYERVLKRSPQLFQEIPHKYIASYLRMTPETLSRLQKS